MKKILLFLLLGLRLNSQAVCGLGYDFNYSTTAGGCDYTFTPVIPGGAPSIAWFEWIISSTGTYGVECDQLDGNPLYYTFCFYGYHKVTMIIHFTSGLPCKVEKTIYVTCSNALLCNPDPSNNSIPDPTVEITYIDPESNCGILSLPKQGCMYATCTGGFCIACGWHWAIKIPETEYNCELFTYRLEYVDVDDCDNGTLTCINLTPGTVYCIFAKLDEDIIIVADGNHCCLPANYQRAFIWHPEPCNSSPGIWDPCPGYDYGECIYRCTPLESNNPCDESSPLTMSQSTSIPSLSCFRSKNDNKSYLYTKTKNSTHWNISNNYLTLQENSNKNQEVIIYNVHGQLVFQGEWNFGNSNGFNLNWPEKLEFGCYFVKFPNSDKNSFSILFKVK